MKRRKGENRCGKNPHACAAPVGVVVPHSSSSLTLCAPPRGSGRSNKQKSRTKHNVSSLGSQCSRHFLVGLGAFFATLGPLSSLLAFFNHTTAVSLLSPPPVSALRLKHPCCASPRALFFLLYVPPGQAPVGGCFEDPRVPLLPAFFAAWTHSTVSTPKCREEPSARAIAKSADRKTARSSLRVLNQLTIFRWSPPGPGFSHWLCTHKH